MKKNNYSLIPTIKPLWDSKILRTMRGTLFLIVLSITQVFAVNTYSQSTRLSLSMKNATIKSILDQVENQSDFYFIYDATVVDVDRKVSIESDNKLIPEILDEIFKDSGVIYKINNRQIALTSASNISSQQTKTVTGKVTDSSGSPLPGVTVVVKGTTQGIITDMDGNYTLLKVPGDAILVFSFVGMKTQEIPVADKTNINITMEEDAIGIEEVVAVGYGSMKKRDVTGAMSSVKSEDFNIGVTTAPEQLLQGKVAGVDIVQISGRPGAASNVRIRGASSISAGNDPLYVIDGIPLQFGSANSFVTVSGESSTSPFSSEASNPLNTINPSDIESIDILKDASATAIYGSRGANGVILITTKKHKGLGETISYDTYCGISSIRKKLPFLSADEYRNYAEKVGVSYSDLGYDTNWQDEIFRTAFSQNHNIAFGGGSENSKYRASLGYNDQQGIIISSELKKYTTRLNATHKAIDGKLNVSLNITYAKVINDDVPVSSNVRNGGGNMLKDALRWAPTLPVYNEDGSYYQIGELRVNPVSWREILDESDTDNFIGSTSLSYNIIKSLTFSVRAGYTDEAVERFTYVPMSNPLGESENGRASIGKFKNSSTTIETTLNYVKDFAGNSSLTLLGGYSFYRYVTQSTFAMANNFVSDATTWNLLQSGTIISNTSNKNANRLSSVFGRANYNLKDRYLVTFTLRNDGSSRFGENNRWGLFPSGAFAWKLSNEEFFNVPTINNLKLRLGYGVTGNQEIPNNLYMEQLSINGSSVYVLGGKTLPSVLPSNYANPDLKWEQTSQLNLGLDFGILDNRLSGSFEIYKKKTSDLLLEFETASPSVVSTQWANVGEVENKGFEITLNGKLISKSNFRWSVDANFSKNVNKVLALSNEQFSGGYIVTGLSSGSGSIAGFYTQIIQEGLPLKTFYGAKYTGLDEDGMETYLDKDADGTPDDYIIGNIQPDFNFGLTNTIFWKRFDASISFRGVVGNEIFNNTAGEYSYTSVAPGENVLRSAITSGVSRSQTPYFSSRWIEDGSYLRLDNLSIGYNLNTSNISFLSKARIYVTGQNLFVITNYTGFDPEVRTHTQTSGTTPEGIDYISYPRPRVFMVGLNVSF